MSWRAGPVFILLRAASHDHSDHRLRLHAGEHAVDQPLGVWSPSLFPKVASKSGFADLAGLQLAEIARAPRGRSRKRCLTASGSRPSSGRRRRSCPRPGLVRTPPKSKKAVSTSARHMLPLTMVRRLTRRRTEAPEGIDRAGVEGWFERQRPGRRAAAQLRSDLRRSLQHHLRGPGRGRTCLGAAPASARQAARLRARHGTRAPGDLGAPGRPRCRCRPVIGLCEDESVNGAPFYVMGFVEGPILRSAEEAKPFDEAERRAIGERVVDTLVAIHAVDPTPSGSATWAARRPTSQRQLKRWQGQWEKSKTRELPAGRRGPRAARRPHPRAGTGDHRPRRLPPRQHDPLALRRGGGGGRLGALHARRPARRRRHAARLLVRGGRRLHAPLRPGDDRPRLPDARATSASATRSAPAAT